MGGSGACLVLAARSLRGDGSPCQRGALEPGQRDSSKAQGNTVVAGAWMKVAVVADVIGLDGEDVDAADDGGVAGYGEPIVA